MRVEHSSLCNEFISFWFETRVDGVHLYDTFIEFLRHEWYTCLTPDGPIVLRGSYESSLSDPAIVVFVKSQVEAALADGRIQPANALDRSASHDTPAIVARDLPSDGSAQLAFPFGQRFRPVRRRVLAFVLVFDAAAVAGGLLMWHVSDARSDPGPVVYLFPVCFALVLGTLPTLTYFLTRWIKQYDVAKCPTCGKFMWPTTIQVMQIAVVPRCPHCWKPLAAIGRDKG